MRLRAFLTVVVAALVVAGCTDGDDDGGGAVTTTSTTAAAVATTSTPTTAPAAATTTTTPVPAEAAIVLRPDGLGVVGFGVAKDLTISEISAVLGPVDETGTGCELAGSSATTARWDELRVQFVGGMFESYNLRPPNGAVPALGLKTEAGIGLGSTVADLHAAYGSRLTIPGLPPEFGGDDFSVSFPTTDRKLYGSLSATTDTGMIRAIFTQVCE
jgi:hypothetical protein